MITLTNGSAHAVVNPDGAWVEELEDDENAIFFPKSSLVDTSGDEKTRGGMHICLPNFGPGGDSGLAQHGFGRTSVWTVLQQDASSVELELKITEGTYSGLVARVEYRLEGNSLTATLSLTNEGAAVLRVAPGFHPYFALNSSERSVAVNGKKYDLAKLGGTEYITADAADVITANRQVTITTENLKTWAIWTDQLGSYVCVEPTFGGNRFLEAEQADERLEPGETKRYSVTISY